jgi:hypothetical protein
MMLRNTIAWWLMAGCWSVSADAQVSPVVSFRHGEWSVPDPQE